MLDALQNMDKTIWVAGLGGALPVALNQFVHSKKGRPDVTPVLSIPFSWEGETRMRTAFRAQLSIAPNSRNRYLIVETVVGKAFELIDEKMAI